NIFLMMFTRLPLWETIDYAELWRSSMEGAMGCFSPLSVSLRIARSPPGRLK
ncbi:MAG: hypothetical protein QOJ40_2756, partial [Verrucomicrobiota bacterium]